MKIVMNRRIINEVLTTYLPTVLILFIVYATTFFKPFYFEAVVTVNLTSLLVLTTLFISVSKSLPPTAYVKMIDIWLIFSQLIPFAEVFFSFFKSSLENFNKTCRILQSCLFKVMLFTFMELLRDDINRKINHHGVTAFVDQTGGQKVFKKTNKINSDGDIETYKEAKDGSKELSSIKKFFRVDYLTLTEFAAKKGIPIVIITFSVLYWSYGLFYFFNPAV